ncbi:MAG TPA: BatA domain-containing protein [Pirellulales bacterium]|jgi:hypothetical protein|nr:BatA domain-containing protein [Pirellulales bacterium]
MDFVTPALLGGALLAAVPVVLHLVMRQQPRHLEFPALRFVRERQNANRRRLRLRHLLLLLLRTAVVGLLAAALARPTIHTASVLGDQEAPVAAALVFDSSPRMDYRRQNQTRLQSAQEIGLWLVQQLPVESHVAVVDGRHTEPVFQIDLGAAQDRIGRLEASPVARPLWERVEAAAKLLEEGTRDGQDLPERKELYVFTDLTRGAWEGDSSARLRQRLAKLPGMGIYVIDVGVAEPQNFALGEVRLSGQVLARNQPWTVGTEISCIGMGENRVVECYLYGREGQPEKRGQEEIEARPGEARSVEFRLGGLDTGSHYGYLQIVGSDGLPFDDRRFFTVDVIPPWKVLIAAAPPVEERTFFLVEALAPEGFRKTGRARFECRMVPFSELTTETFEDHAVVCLVDPGPLGDDAWERLATYAKGGGSVAIFLGPACQPQAFNRPSVQQLLPGNIGKPARYPEGDLYLNTDDSQHPMLAKFRSLRGSIPWDALPVYSYWQVIKPEAGVLTVCNYRNNQPAILEKPMVERQSKGRVLTMTTPVSRVDSSEDDAWNHLADWPENWPYVMLMDQMFAYLAGNSNDILNYPAGATVVLKLPFDQPPSYLVKRIADDPLAAAGDSPPVRKAANPQQPEIRIEDTERPGNYRVTAGGDEGGLDRGFSVNVDPAASDLERIAEERLAEVFGEAKFRVAHNRQEIDRDVSAGRVGRELFGFLMVAVAVVLGLEHLLSNLFYRERR